MRQLVFLTLILWLISSLALGVLFCFTSFEALAAAIRQPNYAAEYAAGPSVFTPARYDVLRGGLLAVAALSSVALLILAKSGRRRMAPSRLRQEWGRGLQSLRRAWQQLDGGQRAVALALAGAALLVRAWLVIDYPITTDELTSYDYYVRPGFAVTASSYSLPNNHLLYNLLVGVLPGLGLPADVQQRLPAIIVGVLLLPISYLLLLRYLRFGAATLALGLFTFAPMPVFYSIAGRGYGLQLAAAVAGLFATLALLRPGRHRLPWLVFVGAGVVGLYTVPTHLYVLVVLGLALLVGFGQFLGQQRGRQLSYLAVATLSIATTTALLYSPVGAVSGWASLLHNPYVHSLSWAEFCQGFYDPYLLGAASQLWGQGKASLLLLSVLAVAAAVGLRRVQQPARALGWVGYGLLLGPLLLLGAQHVFVPARALLMVMLGSFILLALLLQEASGNCWPRLRGRWPRWWRGTCLATLVLIISVYGGYRLHREAAAMEAIAVQHEYLSRQYAWLWAQHPARVWVDSLSRPYQGIYWHHLGLQKQQALPLMVTGMLPSVASRGGREYAVFCRKGGLVPPALLARPPAYADERIYIWQLPAQTPIQ